MKAQIRDLSDRVVAQLNVSGDLHLSEVFSGVGIATEEGNLFGVCQRGTGLEIKCPDGTLVGVKIDAEGDTVIEQNCKQVAGA